jgi:signal transduction histidine kinase
MAASQGPGETSGIRPNTELLLRTDERRRIARDLHDGTSQLLVVLQLQLGRLRRSNMPEAHSLIDECERLIGAIRDQIRAIAPD